MNSMISDLVSIVIPVYNVEQYLNECVDSVIQQTYKNIEIILVDDASPDNCPRICDEYVEKDSRIRVIHKPNGGLSDARNAGLAIAKGEYIYFLDSDDYIEADAIEALIKETAHYSADVVFFDASVFSDTQISNYLVDFYMRRGLYANPLKGIDMLEQLLRYNEYRSAVPLLFIRRDILIKNNLSFYKGILYEDELFTFMLFLQSKVVVHLAEPLYNRRVRENSIMSGKIKAHNFKSIILVASEMVSIYLSTSDSNNREIIKACISRILLSVKSVYHRLSTKDKLALNNELKEFKNLLRINNYLDSQEIKQTCFSIPMLPVQDKIKKYLPLKFKTAIKNIIGRYRNQNVDNDLVLTELKETYINSRIILIGTPVHGNLGDHAIAVAEKELFAEFIPERQVIEIVMPIYRAFASNIKRYINEQDIIIVSGGGWLGTLWKHNEDIVRQIISSYPYNKIVILPQTIFFEYTEEGHKEKEISRKIYSAHTNLIFCLRDKASYDFVLNNNFVKRPEKCLYIPDMVLALNLDTNNKNRDGVLLCFRADREKNMSFRDRRRIKEWLREKGEKTTFTTTVYLDDIPLKNRQKTLDAKFKEFSSAKLVITDRLHGMLFAAVTGTPCIAFDNLTGKVKGVYEWIKYLNYIKVVDNEQEAIKYIDLLLKLDDCVFDNNKLKESFKCLISAIEIEGLYGQNQEIY